MVSVIGGHKIEKFYSSKFIDHTLQEHATQYIDQKVNDNNLLFFG